MQQKTPYFDFKESVGSMTPNCLHASFVHHTRWLMTLEPSVPTYVRHSSFSNYCAGREGFSCEQREQAYGARSRSGADPKTHADPEVVAQAKRRRFTAEYKQRILADADRVKGSGGVGALLRRESLYSSLLTTWRRERDAVVLQALARPKNADPSPSAIPSPKKTTSCAGRLCN
jgi:transposase-like protein